MFQNHRDYLNIWVPIIKPELDKSNLSIIPFDAIKARSASLHDRLAGGGATDFVTHKGRHWLVDNMNGRRFDIGFDLGELSVTPQLAAGDALIFRGDIVHRTQDVLTQRVAASFRIMRSASPVSRKRFVRGSWRKYRMMVQAPQMYATILDCFEEARSEELTVHHLVEWMRTRGMSADSRVFPLRLLGEKARSLFL
jgi:hypothetical protein